MYGLPCSAPAQPTPTDDVTESDEQLRELSRALSDIPVSDDVSKASLSLRAARLGVLTLRRYLHRNSRSHDQHRLVRHVGFACRKDVMTSQPAEVRWQMCADASDVDALGDVMVSRNNALHKIFSENLLGGARDAEVEQTSTHNSAPSLPLSENFATPAALHKPANPIMKSRTASSRLKPLLFQDFAQQMMTSANPVPCESASLSSLTSSNDAEHDSFVTSLMQSQSLKRRLRSELEECAQTWRESEDDESERLVWGVDTVKLRPVSLIASKSCVDIHSSAARYNFKTKTLNEHDNATCSSHALLACPPNSPTRACARKTWPRTSGGSFNLAAELDALQLPLCVQERVDAPMFVHLPVASHEPKKSILKRAREADDAAPKAKKRVRFA